MDGCFRKNEKFSRVNNIKVSLALDMYEMFLNQNIVKRLILKLLFCFQRISSVKEGYVPLNHLKKIPKNAEGTLMKTIIDDAKKEETTQNKKCK